MMRLVNLLADALRSPAPDDNFRDEQENLHNRFMTEMHVAQARETMRIILLANGAALAATWAYISKTSPPNLAPLVTASLFLFAVGSLSALACYVTYWFFLREGARVGINKPKAKRWVRKEWRSMVPFGFAVLFLILGAVCAGAELCNQQRTASQAASQSS